MSSGKAMAFTVSHSRGKKKTPRRKRFLGYTIRTVRYRYTEWGEKGEHGVEMYDHTVDPHEYTNLARKAGHSEVLARMKILLEENRKATR